MSGKYLFTVKITNAKKQTNMNTHIDLSCIAYKNPWMLWNICVFKLQYPTIKTSKTNKLLITKVNSSHV